MTNAGWFAISILLLTCSMAPARAAQLVLYNLAHAKAADSTLIASRRQSWDEMQLVASLQGIVNRRDPRLYTLLVGENARTDRYWLARMQDKGEWLAQTPLQTIPDVISLVKHFRKSIRGAVVWDERVPATSNVASTAAGVESAVVVRYDPTPGSLYDRLIQRRGGPRLPVLVRLIHADGTPLFTGQGVVPKCNVPSTGSAKCDAYVWAVERYLKNGRCDATNLAYYPDAYWLQGKSRVPPDRTLLSNHDYFIAHRGFFFDLSPWDDEAPDDDLAQPLGADFRTLQLILRTAYEACHGRCIHVGGFTPWDQKYTDFTGRKHGGVATEWRYAELLSCYNAFMDADAPGLHAMANASLYQHYPLKSRYPQPNLPTDDTLRQKGWLNADGTVAAHTYVTIYVGDYDSAAWLYERAPDLWDDPARGSVPLGWAFDPMLEMRFPLGLAYTRKTASPMDTFITGDSGAGYLNPGYLDTPRKWSGLPSGIAAWEAFSTPLYKRWDLRITGFVIDGNAPAMSERVKEAYARFSPDGIVAQKIPEESLVNGVPFLRMGSDITGTPEQGAETIAHAAPKTGPAFAIYRTILWSPTAHKTMFERLKTLRPDIVVVDPYTLFLLLKHHLQTPAADK